ncbi:MAG: hypothetical protein M1816_000251 [Peltula sp. TS41687]|nr:MAG: hypothetical protein M1816_000251 [Peltula sp. TS41687]
MSKPTETGGKRRKSAGFFPRATISALTPIRDDTSSNPVLKKKSRPASFFIPSAKSDAESKTSKQIDEHCESPKHRPRTLLKNGRPSSIFGSLRTRRLSEEEEQLTSPLSKESSMEDEREWEAFYHGSVVLHHGEVQTTGGMFRKRKEYLVLTDTYLLRFKSYARAVEVYPSIAAPLGRSYTPKHTSTISSASGQDLYSAHSHSSAEDHLSVPLHHIIAAYKVEDGRPYFSIEIAQLDEETNHAASVNLQFSDPRDAALWLSSIRGAATKARLPDPIPFPQRTVEYVARILEQERDYDPAHFRIFKAIQRASNKTTARSSSDDLAKLGSTICYLVIGVHKVHLIPLRKSSNRISSPTLNEMGNRMAFGILTLSSVNVKGSDDAFELGFRFPLRKLYTLNLASSASTEIALWLRHEAVYLRPEWLEQPFLFQVPRGSEDLSEPISIRDEDHHCLDRTLIAHCAAYDINTSNIRYTIHYDVEDAPQFMLLPPASLHRTAYSPLEWLAVLRTLRYNESFRSISFGGNNLDVLHGLRDGHGIEHIAWECRSGVTLDLQDRGQKSLLVQEIQGIALKSKKLRRMDFSNCIIRKPQDDDTGVRDPGCEVVEALFPLCRRLLTNVDWIVLNGIVLGETDLDYLVDAAVERACHLRALEISRCGLTDRSLQLILNAMLSQDNTLESIDISGNLARLSPSTFQSQIGHFGFIRKLNLSRVHRNSGPEPLVAPETILTWRLEQLDLSETAVNEQTVDSVSAYLASTMSDTLREIRLNQCGLTGKDVAIFLRSMSRGPGQARNLHLENRLEKDHDELVAAIAGGFTPTHLTMRMVEYQKEDHFRELILAMKNNTTLKYLDISKASLPFDASDETCEALQQMFMENETLEEVDISGEHAHLEVAKFGIGLNHALTGLKKNKTLKVLRIEYQKLGLQGANTLSSVLEDNSTLREIYCENNDINLQAMTVLVDGLARNKFILYLPRMDSDRASSLMRLEKEYQSIRSTEPTPNVKQSSVRRTLATVRSAKGTSATTQPAYTEQDIRDALMMMSEKWDRQASRLEQILLRNINIARGVPVPSDHEEEQQDRPSSGNSFTTMLKMAAQSTTPTLEDRDPMTGGTLIERLSLNNGLTPPSSPPRRRETDDTTPPAARAELQVLIPGVL